jgi:hypothetical protein
VHHSDSDRITPNGRGGFAPYTRGAPVVPPMDALRPEAVIPRISALLPSASVRWPTLFFPEAGEIRA